MYNVDVKGVFTGSNFRNSNPVWVKTNPNGRKNLFKMYTDGAHGDYSFCVDKIEKDGYTWDKSADTNRCINHIHDEFTVSMTAKES